MVHRRGRKWDISRWGVFFTLALLVRDIFRLACRSRCAHGGLRCRGTSCASAHGLTCVATCPESVLPLDRELALRFAPGLAASFDVSTPDRLQHAWSFRLGPDASQSGERPG